MDFRNNRPVPPNQQTSDNLGSSRIPSPKPVKPKKDSAKLIKTVYIGFLIAIAVLLLGMVLSIAFAKDKQTYREGNYVQTDQLQAVFLNGGQVYFGKITDLNSKFLSLNNIYYLRPNQQVQPEQQQNTPVNPSNYTLVKLGCEPHGPEDSMIINREQVMFWENLKTDGQIAKLVDEYVKNHPNGQKCETNNSTNQNNNQQNNNSSNTQNTNQNNSQNTSDNTNNR